MTTITADKLADAMQAAVETLRGENLRRSATLRVAYTGDHKPSLIDVYVDGRIVAVITPEEFQKTAKELASAALLEEHLP